MNGKQIAEKHMAERQRREGLILEISEVTKGPRALEDVLRLMGAGLDELEQGFARGIRMALTGDKPGPQLGREVVVGRSQHFTAKSFLFDCARNAGLASDGGGLDAIPWIVATLGRDAFEKAVERELRALPETFFGDSEATRQKRKATLEKELAACESELARLEELWRQEVGKDVPLPGQATAQEQKPAVLQGVRIVA